MSAKSAAINLMQSFLGGILRSIPPVMRSRLYYLLVLLATDKKNPIESLQFLFQLDNALYSLEGGMAVIYGDGVHPKHRLTHYHDFFIAHLMKNDRVLDIGCGNGSLAYDLVTNRNDISVLGIDINLNNIEHAKKHYFHPHLEFVKGDVIKDLPDTHFTVIVLSNVLEHIKHRSELLADIQKKINPDRYLIRVPLFERDWRVPLKKEIGIEYRLDGTHETEYLPEDFFAELAAAGLTAIYNEFRWGELWCLAVPVSREGMGE